MRLEGKGRINRKRRLGFYFDGRRFEGFEGDTLASALLANEVRLVGRSFKYHRPRGIMTAGCEEPNALVTIGRGSEQDPNVRATTQEIYEGLDAYSQNRWPSLGFDVLSANNLFAPFFGAGFYYKTFMWPRAFWERVYEPLIRRAAGLGTLSGEAPTDRYEKAYAFCDLLVIGAGPAGLMAALTAGRAGADVILADEDFLPGGRLNAENETIGDQSGADWAASVVAELESLPNVRLMRRTTVTGVYDQGTFGALERVRHHNGVRGDGAPLETFWRIVAKRSVLAAGAIERPVAFANNDRPGVMMASAVRSYLNRWGVSPGKAVTIFGNTDGIHQTARDLLDAGVHIAGVIDSRHDGPTSNDYPVYRGAQVCGTRGGKELEAITYRDVSGTHSLQTDCLAMSGGWNPSVHLSCHLNGRPVWNRHLAAFVPDTDAVPGMIAAGACNGAFSTAGAMQQGVRAGQQSLNALGINALDMPMPQAQDDPYRITELWAVSGKGRAWLDFQNDVTVKDVHLATREGYRSVEHMKRYTTQGMAPDQGKNSNVAALAVLADATGQSIPETGTTTFRPPFVPVSIAAMGAGAMGKGFAPERFTTSHAESVKRGAPMIEAGLWYRPSYFPIEGETTWRQSCDREVSMVRTHVGVCDVSTLGKIDIQGPDAGAFLDLIYTNMFSTLKVGRVRYGLMLRDDGHVMDDGTTARLGQDHFLMTTTTAAAGEVMRHLEFVHQCVAPELQVRFASVTEHWAQFAVAGPKSRDLLNMVLDAPLKGADWPFMACGNVLVGGVAGRLFRISFSGEHAYEIAVPARYGASLFEALLNCAETLQGGPYGMEALNVMRIEKGLITHAEIHGRTTAFDIGMQGMMSKKKPFIGKPLSEREGLMDEGREQLVGLEPIGEKRDLTAGAHLFATNADAVRVNDQGYITSVGYSPSLGKMLALGFVKDGRNRRGETLRMVDHLRGLETLCVICDPVFVDPKGDRVRG